MPSIYVTLWSFDKKKNSTKLPVSAGTEFTGEIKQSFTLTGLEIRFNLGAQLVAPTYNYAQISSLRRYYFITDWYYDRGFWVAVMAVDVLASFRVEIGNSSQFVLRAFSRYAPGVIDTSYPTTGEVTRTSSQIAAGTFWGADVTQDTGLIVMGVIGNSSSSVGAVTYYALTMPAFRTFLNAMLSSISWANISITEISEELQKALINPAQYIVSCRWFPILASAFTQGTAVSSINLGWWSFTAPARVLNTVGSAWVSRQSEFSIPVHPQRGGRGGYLRLSPYSSYMLKFLPFGVFEIDSTELFNADTLGILVDTNLMTGDSVLHLAAKKVTEGQYNWDNSFLVVESQIGVPLPVGQVSADVANYQNALTAGVVAGAGDIARSFSQEKVASTSHHSGKF